MAGRNATIAVAVVGEADFDRSRADAKRAAEQIEGEFDSIEISPELDTAEIQKAISLAKQLDGLTAELNVDTDISEIVQAEALARSLRGFQARVDLSVDGEQELRDALNLSEQMERLRTVRLEVQGRQDLERAAEIADDLERRRTVPIDAQASDLVRLDDQIGDAITSGGEAGAEGVAGALADVDYADIGGTAADQLTGALSAAGPWGAAAAGIAAVFGDEFIEGFNNRLSGGRATMVTALRYALDESELQAAGEAGGAAYSAGLGEGLAESKEAAAILISELAEVDESLDLKEVTRQALALEEVFGVEAADSVRLVSKLLALDLMPNATAAYDALFRLGQQTGADFDEALEVTNEFSNSFSRLGIQGPQALELIARSFNQNLFAQLDNGGEVFEEFVEIIESGGAAEALQEIGFSAQEMQGYLADGRGAEAMALIAQRLADMPDKGRAAALAVEIFGGNMSKAADPQIALQWLAQADAIAENGANASKAADDLESVASPLRRLGDYALAAGNAMAGPLADGLDTLKALVDTDMDEFVDGITDVGAAIIEHLANPLAGLGVDILPEPINDAIGWVRDLGGEAEEMGGKMAHASPELQKGADGAAQLAGEMDGATQAVDDFQAELEGLFNFSADQLFREVADAGRELAEQLDADAVAAVGFQGAIDVSTEAGSKLQARMEDLNGTLVDAAIANANGELSSLDLARAQQELQRQFDGVASEAGLTKEQVEGLRQKYLTLPADVTTRLSVIDNATAVVRNLQTELSKLKDKTITVTTKNAIIAATAASTQVREKARGGWTEGLTLVGEEGPELIDVKGRAFVHNATATRDIVAGWDDIAGGASPSPGQGRGRAFIENATFIVDRGMDLWQQADLAEQVYGFR